MKICKGNQVYIYNCKQRTIEEAKQKSQEVSQKGIRKNNPAKEVPCKLPINISVVSSTRNTIISS